MNNIYRWLKPRELAISMSEARGLRQRSLGQDRVKATYRDNYDRLVAVKNKYDLTNLFRVNQNVKPT